MNRFLAISVFYLCIGVASISQQALDFDNLTIEDGFASSKANVMIQDRKGFIWIGSWNGLTRYDGYECKIYKPNHRDSSSISNKEVVSLLEDHNGDIWIGTSFGLNCLNSETGAIRTYPFENRIMAIYEDKNLDMWVGTWNDGLYKLNRETGEKTHFLPNYIISDIIEDSQGEFWVATYMGLIKVNRETGRYKNYLSGIGDEQFTIKHNVVTQLIQTDNKVVWFGTWGGGLSKIIPHQNSDSIQFVHYSVRPGIGSMSVNDAYALYNDQFGNIWIGTWNGGLMLLSRDEQNVEPSKAKFMCYKSEIDNPYSLSGDNITAILVDRSGLLWVGSSKIDRTSILNTGIRRYNTPYNSNGKIIQSTVRAFAGDDNNNLWIGTTSDLRGYKLSGNNYQLITSIDNQSYSYKGQTYQSSLTLSILADDNKLWVGTDDAGLLLYNKREAMLSSNPKFKFLNTDTDPSIPGNKVSCIEKSKKYENVIWLGTMQNGFVKCIYRNNKFETVAYFADGSNPSLSDNNIRDICEDGDGKVWIATQKGLNCFDPETETFKSFYYTPSNPHSINDNIINVIHEDKNENLWIGTNAGLNKKVFIENSTNPDSIGFKSYAEIDFLRSELITNILEDDSASIWVSSYQGIVQFDEVNEIVKREYFTKEYQRVGNERGSNYKDINGNFFIGGSNGFLMFYPGHLKLNTQGPKLCFTDFNIYNKPVDENTHLNGRQVLKKTMAYTDSMELTHREDMFSVFFSSMDYKDPLKNKYKYILEGYDDDWNEVGTRNSAIYTGVPPGDYTLLVKGTNSDGLWSSEPLRMFIKIIPPWWKSDFAFGAYVLLFIGLLYFFNKYSVIRIKEKSNLMLEKVRNEKEHELNELKSHFFTNITHEFRTPLTLILGPVDKIINDTNVSTSMKKQLTLVQRNASRLLRLVNQLMEFRKVEKGKIELFLQKVNVIPLLVELHDSFKTMADAKRIDFSLNYKQSTINAWLDLDKFEKVLFNLLSNAFKFTDDGGRITIDVEVGESDNGEPVLCIDVEDTGIGIPENKKEMIFERFYQVHQKKEQSTGGIGLYLSYAFMQLHQGQINVSSTEGQGSTFQVVMPLNLNEQIGENEKVVVDGKDSVKEPIDQLVMKETEVVDQQKNDSNVFENSSKHKLLLVEDDIDLNEFVADGLSSDFDVVTCFNGQEGLKIAKEQHPDIIVTDIMMPELDGLEMCKLLRKEISTSHIPLIFITAKTLKEDKMEGLRLGAVDYISKPFDLTSLNLKLNNILKTKQNLQEKLRTQMLLEPDEIELTSLDESFLKDIVDAVNKHLDNPEFDVDMLSKEVGMSSNQVYRKIKSLTGQTAKEFIRSQRLKTSANLLLQKKRSISEIIYMVGFSSPSYFTRCFREHFGCTPSEYIEKEGATEKES